EKKTDSAYQFIKSSFYRRARDFEIYRMLLNLAVVHRDSTEIIKAYQHYNGIHHQPKALTESAVSLLRTNVGTKKVMDFVEEEKQGFLAMDNPDPKADSLFLDMYNRIGQQFMTRKQPQEAYAV